MATRSSISIRNEDGTYTGIYCHWDGYLECNGKILLEHYSDEAKIRELMSLGNISTLGTKVGSQNGSKRSSPDECYAYGRDIGEEDCGCITSATRSELLNTLGQEYNYVWENGRWLVSCSLTDYAFVDLETLINNRKNNDE